LKFPPEKRILKFAIFMPCKDAQNG
jgi:hypothetical protein